MPGGVRPASSGEPTVSPTVLPADVSHRDHDGQAGELRGHEGRLGQLRAAPPPPPLQLPVPAPHALGPHPQEGQGALHLQVRWGLQGGAGGVVLARGPQVPRCGCEPGLPGQTIQTQHSVEAVSGPFTGGGHSLPLCVCGGGGWTSPAPAGCVSMSTRKRSLSLAGQNPEGPKSRGAGRRLTETLGVRWKARCWGETRAVSVPSP